ncbi:MAG: type II toxin-antitoxin system VapC family toxin [Acidimicrobiia bacterium]|nr:type II toxin-antitoxin system VapC family toxin [Acidimicrobiia bacterium]MYC57892.1 type II toxin-antitoxin system VapC family toxin [Acidimicrobiia bacterium]MYG93401.1 type II toxin-antitoxin system VapC family toxin [Acidimicrobiia bacterium]MYI29800.1 type II toxin-antitoxin system VapC family toxin [Acidimicrobiia bacterium]
MIIADASVIAEKLLRPNSLAATSLAKRLAARQAVCAPHLLDAEIGQAIRRFVLRGEISATRATEAFEDLADLPIRRFPHTELLPRAFALRSNVTVYDGIYLALAEALDALLVSCDAALADVAGCKAAVEILPVSD